ncbi:MAG: imelysin family protein [Pseudomonadota bacterium]
MIRAAITVALLAICSPASAKIADILEGITTSFATLEQTAKDLADAPCSDLERLRAGYNRVFDAWNEVSHFRFGPMEAQDRAYAMAFWPDTRGATPKTLRKLIAAKDVAVQDQETFAEVSIAARGLFALEMMLYEPSLSPGPVGYNCDLTRAITSDIYRISQGLSSEWPAFADQMRAPSGTFDSQKAVQRAFFTALTTGLQFNTEVRLGRPLGSLDKPRPRRAEARRSGRSLLNVRQSLQALRLLALSLSEPDSALTAALDRAARIAADLNDPVFAGVATPAGRNKVEILQQAINLVRDAVAQNLGPQLGVAAGFNALDGD